MSLRKFLCAAVFSITFSSLFAAPVRVEDLTPFENMPKDRPSVALVLAGGGAKGFAELPIMEYIDQLDIPIDMIVGTSVGAIVGGFYSAGYTALEMVNEFSQVDWTPYFTDAEASPYESVYGIHGKTENLVALNFDDHLSLRLGSAVSNGQLAYQLFRKMLIKYPSNKSFDELEIPFRAVATDMLTGDAIVLQDGDLAEAIRASMSLPGVFQPMNYDGYYFTDGGLRYNLPINVAKAMGFDIVIAIDVSAEVLDDPEAYNSNPAVSLMNALTIAEHASLVPLYDQADLIITPNYHGYTTMDFGKSKEIYEAGKSNLDEYKEALENIRRKIYPKDYDKNGKRISAYKEPKDKGTYHNREYYKPRAVISQGAFNKDVQYIYNSFEKIKEKELTPAKLDAFLNDLYLTGNYTSIRTRIMDFDGQHYINLQMKQRPQKEMKALLNIDLEQTFSSTSTTRSDIEFDIQARGYTGVGSIFSVHGTFLTDYGIEVYYMQPVDPYLFTESVIGIFDEIYPQKANDIETLSTLTGFTKIYYQLNFGLRTPNSNLAKLGLSYNGIFPKYTSYSFDPFIQALMDNEEIDEENPESRIYGQYFGATFHTDFGTLNSKAFPSKGWYFSPTLKFIIPFYRGMTFSPIFAGDADFRFAIPFSKKISLCTSFKMGMDFSEGMLDFYPIIPYEGFSSYDRLYFPSITSKNRFGTNLAAVRCALQFKPKEQLTILGGELMFRIEGTAGVVNYNWKDSISQFTNPETDYPILWSGTFGVGVKGNKNFNALIRVGACSTYSSKATFLFGFDMGTLMF